MNFNPIGSYRLNICVDKSVFTAIESDQCDQQFYLVNSVLSKCLGTFTLGPPMPSNPATIAVSHPRNPRGYGRVARGRGNSSRSRGRPPMRGAIDAKKRRIEQEPNVISNGPQQQQQPYTPRLQTPSAFGSHNVNVNNNRAFLRTNESPPVVTTQVNIISDDEEAEVQEINSEIAQSTHQSSHSMYQPSSFECEYSAITGDDEEEETTSSLNLESGTASVLPPPNAMLCSEVIEEVSVTEHYKREAIEEIPFNTSTSFVVVPQATQVKSLTTGLISSSSASTTDGGYSSFRPLSPPYSHQQQQQQSTELSKCGFCDYETWSCKRLRFHLISVHNMAP